MSESIVTDLGRWLLDLRLSPSQSAGVVLLVAFVIGSLWQIRDLWRQAGQARLVQAPPRTALTFPAGQSSAYLRDLAPARDEAPDGLFETAPRAMLRHYSTRTIEAMRRGEPAAGYARMAASIAFRLYPHLRPGAITVSPLSAVVDPGEADGLRRRAVRSMDVEVMS